MLYLYIKIHKITGLKYFGQTTAVDPYEYKGSGTYWKNHLKKHGNNVDTIIIKEYECKCDDAIEFAKQFSVDNNIVESAEWANLKIECVDGGWDHVNNLPREVRMEYMRKWRESLSEEDIQLINKKKSRPGNLNGMFGVRRCGEDSPMYGKRHTEHTKDKIRDKNKNKIVVKDSITGEVVGFFDKDNPKILSGEWVSVNKGRKATMETKDKMSKTHKELGTRPPSPKGLLWWNNGIFQIRSVDCPGPEYIRGRLNFKRGKNKDKILHSA